MLLQDGPESVIQPSPCCSYSYTCTLLVYNWQSLCINIDNKCIMLLNMIITCLPDCCVHRMIKRFSSKSKSLILPFIAASVFTPTE